MGPGDSVASAVLTRAFGGSASYQVDVGAFANRDLATYRAIADYAASQGFRWAGELGADFEDMLRRCDARYLTDGLSSLRLVPDSSVDFAYSHAALEHVRVGEFAETMQELRRILKPGGRMSHQVDLKDHLSGGLNNLRFSTRTWESALMSQSGFYTNRIAFSEMTQLMRDAGFATEVLKRNCRSDVPLARRNSRLNSRTEAMRISSCRTSSSSAGRNDDVHEQGSMMRTVLVTGTAGFIGFHLSRLLLAEGFRVVGVDAMTDYYDVRLKQARHAQLRASNAFSAEEFDLLDADRLLDFARKAAPDAIVHLAAQAGVRYSIENPRAYIDTNVVGTFNVMEAARELGVAHLLMASTSSVYGANTDMPFTETQKADTPLTIYAATKKATEAMAHSYAHLWDLPTTMFRFFTVYGPWGRPDMALFKFVKGVVEGTPIDIYNHGAMWRDFTYVEDLVRAIRLLIDAPPVKLGEGEAAEPGDSLSPVAPFRIVNIGNSDKVRLEDFIDAVETELGRPAIRNYMGMQTGDVPATWADASLLKRLTGYAPATDVKDGIKRFVAWYREYYGC
jgi:UDP-glucuronate 4-epimerase